MLNIMVTERKRQKRKIKKHPLFLYTIIPFLTFLIYISVFSGLPIKNLPDFFFYTPPKVQYNTFKVSFDEEIPLGAVDAIKASVDDIHFEDIKRFEFVKRGGYKVEYTQDTSKSFYFKQYVPVGHIYWIKGETTLDDIRNDMKVYVSSDEYELSKVFLTQLLGDGIEIVKSDDLITTLKESEEYIAFVPYEDLNEAYKVLSLDGKFCLIDSKGCLSVGYKLGEEKDSEFVSGILNHNMRLKYGENIPVDTNQIAKINMSGVVAMSRGLASKMDSSKDYSYPARGLGNFLSDADLTHVSNEVSFVKGCTGYSGMRFCSKPEYIEALKASGVDIVELTGNHNNDYGSSYNTETINIYKELGWDYFGGGLNNQDASKVLYREVKGNLIAFVGYNYYNTMYDQAPLAKATTAGANSYSVDKLTKDISQAKEKGALVIVTFQFQECYCYPPSDVIYPICYKPLSSPDQKKVFRQAIDLGADIVVGTQAHQPQTYEIYNSGIIFYGLGNLYFDQDDWIGTRQGIVLSLYISENDLKQVSITPTIMDSSLIPKVASKTDSDFLLNLLMSARSF
jgi:hypothetical protein